VNLARGTRPLWHGTRPGSTMTLIPAYGSAVAADEQVVTLVRYDGLVAPDTQRFARVVVAGLDPLLVGALWTRGKTTAAKTSRTSSSSSGAQARR